MGQSQTRVITTHVPVEMAEKIDELAAIIEQEENRHHMILQGLANVDEGKVVEQAEVLKWVNSLNSDTPLPVPQSGQK